MKTVFCPVDFSSESELAAEWASIIAIKRNWKVVLFKMVSISSDSKKGAINNSHDAKRESEGKLLQLKTNLCKKFESNNLTCNIDTDSGNDTEDVILRAAEKAKADLIVMGTKGAQSFSKIIGGSNTTGVINQTNIPVLVIPEGVSIKLPDHFIYASDLKNEDHINLTYVMDLAKDLKAKITFLHIKRREEPTELANLKHLLSDYTTNYLSTSDRGYISYDEIETYNFTTTLLEYATQKGAGMIVMGRHPKNFFEKVFKGDQTRLMALYTSIPLLILHKKK